MIKIGDKEFVVKYFPDGTLNMTDVNIPVDTIPLTISWLFENIAEQVVIYNLKKFIDDKICIPVILYMPYVLNARMDRTKDQQHEVHTLKYFCDFINDLNFLRVVVRDVHSPVTMSLLDRAVELNVKEYVERLIEELQPDYVYFPDDGSYHRYQYLITRTPFFGDKQRDWKTGEIKGVKIINPYNIAETDYQGKSILQIDDISSYGGTFFHGGNALKAMGFGKVYLYITFAEYSILKGKLVEPDSCIEHIFTMMMVGAGEGEHEKITVL